MSIAPLPSGHSLVGKGLNSALLAEVMRSQAIRQRRMTRRPAAVPAVSSSRSGALSPRRGWRDLACRYPATLTPSAAQDGTVDLCPISF